MYSVLLQEDSVQAAVEEPSMFPVNISVLSNGTFVPDQAVNYQVEADSLTLFGSGGSPREFRVTFTLSAETQQEGYKFANPALKIFGGQSREAGYRVSPDPSDQLSTAVSLFNTMKVGDPVASDRFSVLLVDPNGQVVSHDPTILWEPPLS